MRRLRSLLADSGPVLVLAVIAAVGSFTHISDLAAAYGQEGWQAWAVAVCIDLMCVMAAREIQRDKRTGRAKRGLISWPSLVLTGGIVLTLAANLAQAHPSPWGWIVAATPAGAFLIAMSMLERRAGHTPPATPAGETPGALPPAAWHLDTTSDPHRYDQEGPAAELEADERPQLTAPPTAGPAPSSSTAVPGLDGVSDGLIAFARRVAADHYAAHGRPITAEALRARLRISPELAATLHPHVTTEPTP